MNAWVIWYQCVPLTLLVANGVWFQLVFGRDCWSDCIRSGRVEVISAAQLMQFCCVWSFARYLLCLWFSVVSCNTNAISESSPSSSLYCVDQWGSVTRRFLWSCKWASLAVCGWTNHASGPTASCQARTRQQHQPLISCIR